LNEGVSHYRKNSSDFNDCLHRFASDTGTREINSDNRNQRPYNRNITAKEIVLDGKVAPPSAAEELLSEVNEQSPKNLSR